MPVRIVLAVLRPVVPRRLEVGDRVLERGLRGGQGVAQLRLGDVAAHRGVLRAVVTAAQLGDVAVVVGLQLLQQVPEEAGRLALPRGLVLAERLHPPVDDVRVVLEELHRPVEGLARLLEGLELDSVAIEDRQVAEAPALGGVVVQQLVQGQFAAGDVLRHRAGVPLDVRVRALELTAAGDRPVPPQVGAAVVAHAHTDHHDPRLLQAHAVVRAVAARVVEGQVVVLALALLEAAERRVVLRGHRAHGLPGDLHPEQLQVGEVVAAVAAEGVEQAGPGRDGVAGEIGDRLGVVVVRVVGGRSGSTFAVVGHGTDSAAGAEGGGGEEDAGPGVSCRSRCRSCRRPPCRRCPSASRLRSRPGCRPASSAAW